MKLPRFVRISAIIAAVLAALVLILAYPAYLIAAWQFERYFDQWGDRLVDLEKRGLLSTEFGAAWQDILTDESMQQTAARITADSAGATRDTVAIVDGVHVRDYPSLSLVRRLNEIHSYSNTIEIQDRNARRIALIRTNHTRGTFNEFPQTLITALVAAEDERYFENKLGFEFKSYVRAAMMAARKSAMSLRLRKAGGTSTITQQVAKLFISKLDSEGRRLVNRDIDRKLREMRIAVALRKMYTPEQILEVYFNHCVTSDYGLVGYKDIALGLFGCKPSELTDAQCLYLARMVKWGRNLKDKITRQCHIDMPRMAVALKWDQARQDSVLAQIDSITFEQPKRVVTAHGQLVDCANEYWLRILSRNGTPPEELDQLDLIDPSSLVRKKGNLVLRLSIDLALQKAIETLVNARGYGADTTVVTEARIGSDAADVTLASPPGDTLRHTSILAGEQVFSEPGAEYKVRLRAGDTLISNIRYKAEGSSRYRRSVFYYARRPVLVDGQYYAYAAMDSRTGKLLAYYSRDRIGSKLAGLVRYRTPNGSSTAKPIFNALCFDHGQFKPWQSWNDSTPATDDVSWKRSMARANGRDIGVVFDKSAVRGRGYEVHNHGDVLEGCQYIFDALATSNNILGVETCYRMDRQLFDRRGDVPPEALPTAQFFYRLGVLGRIKDDLRLTSVTGVRVYKELARIAGAKVDSAYAGGTARAISDSLYSVALGTLELSLLEQLHIYNVLYNNDIIERPADHPSLFVDSILLNDRAVTIPDTIKRYHPLADLNNIRPSWLGMHKRLTSNTWDRLGDYDIAWPADSVTDSATIFDPLAFSVEAPLSNFAKSGTTDDVIRPYYAGPSSSERTNYGLWNAVLRLDLGKLGGDSSDIRDITIACIGECVTRYTGARDGKSLHGFLTRELLRKAGVPAPNGYFKRYEAYLRRTTPPQESNCGRGVPDSAVAPDTARIPEVQGQ